MTLQGWAAVLLLAGSVACETRDRHAGTGGASGDPAVSNGGGSNSAGSNEDETTNPPSEEAGGAGAAAVGGASGDAGLMQTASGGDATSGSGAPSDSGGSSNGGDPPGGAGAAAGEEAGASGSSGDMRCEPNRLRCNGERPEVCDADQVWRPLLACEAPKRCVAGECKAPIDNACPLVPTLPRFDGGTLVVDGDGSEFAGIEPVTYALKSAPVVSRTYSANLPTTVSLRLAWSEDAFVAHVHVEDPAIYTYSGGILEYFWQGDNVQFFIAPTDALTGKYSGTEDGGAIHLVIVPPSATNPAAAIEVYEPCYACVDASLSTVSYAARAVTGGYEIELYWPWSSPNGSFSPGDRVALNLIVGAQDSSSSGLQLEGLLANNPVAGETPCGGATHPGCDDRTWCYSELE